MSDLLSALQINTGNSQPSAVGRGEVTDITETGVSVMRNLQHRASESYDAQLRRGCLQDLSGDRRSTAFMETQSEKMRQNNNMSSVSKRAVHTCLLVDLKKKKDEQIRILN